MKETPQQAVKRLLADALEHTTWPDFAGIFICVLTEDRHNGASYHATYLAEEELILDALDDFLARGESNGISEET